MRLLLSMLAWPDGMKPETRDTDTELVIGRGTESGWVLADPARRIGRRHCQFTPYGDVWQITDLSLNGTFLNDDTQPIGRERSQELHDGDRVRIGAYVIEARYQAPASLQMPHAEPAPFQPVRDNAIASGPWQPAPWDSPPPEYGDFSSPGPARPNELIGAPSPDHSPAISDIWHAPPPGRVVLPDDWDLEGPKTATPQPPVPVPAAPGVPQLPEDWDRSLIVPPVPSVDRTSQPEPAPRPTAPPPPPVVEEGAPPPAAPQPAASDTALLAAFWRGAGVTATGESDPVAMMEAVGKLVRVTVDRLRAVQIGRSAIKREFRIQATRFRFGDNNPIKFSADTDAALQAILGGKRAPDKVVGEILDGIRTHELAMIAAMQDAVRVLLDTLSPDHVRAAAEEHGRASVLPLQRRARAFEQYELLHAKTVRAMADDFDSVFGKTFALAYERVALDEEDTPGGRPR